MSQDNDILNQSTTFSLRDLRVCRGCLDTDARMYDMRQNRLLEAYTTLLNTATVQVTDDLPQYLCSYCAVLLLKCDTFRMQCLDSLIVLSKATQQNLYLTPEYLKMVRRPTYINKCELEKLAIVDIQTSNYSDISTDSDISSDTYSNSNESDVFIASDDLYVDECLSDNESYINLKSKPTIRKHKRINSKHDYSDDEIGSLLKKHLGDEKSSLLKYFNVNIACEANNAIINIRDHQMHQLSEIVNHIQYSSETSNELLEILNEDILKCENEASKYVNKTTEKCKVMKQQSESNAKAKTINEQEVAQTSKEGAQQDIVKDITIKSEFEIEYEIQPVLINNVNSNAEIPPLLQNVDIQLDVPQDTYIVTQCDVKNEALDSEDDIALADLKLDSKPPKANKVTSYTGNYKDLIQYTLQQKRRNLTDEYFANYNTEVIHLSKEEQIMEIHDRKESDNYINGVYKCNICFKGFLLEEPYKNHMLLHDDISGKFVCDVCQCHFMTNIKLFRHQRVHKKVFICKECGHTTKQSYIVIEHYRQHKGKNYSCEYCGKEFTKNSSKYAHIRMFHQNSDQLVRCEICGDSFNGLSGLACHDKKAHKEMSSPECLCPGCDTQFYCSAAFKAHQGTDGLCDATHKYCVRCGMAFETEQLLKEHEAEQQKPQDQNFECDICHKTFKHLTKFKLHQKYHSNKFHKCSLVKCEVCGISVKNADDIKQHYISAHSDHKPYKCKICTKGFSTQGLLKRHNYVHMGKRPYKCKLCSKKFKDKYNLKRHGIFHSEERPHSCEFCGKSYKTKNCVKKHIKIVHMKIPMPPRNRRRNIKTE